MRTTIALDDDVATKLQEMAHKRRISFRKVVNEVLRRGLSAQDQPRATQRAFHVDAFDSPFRPGVDPQRLNQLVDDLEVERFGGRAR
ncbi:MAG TPA: hypothetical protein VHG72_02120 [Polyangia bacterium]|nr:hypothetical protein [Polyangia bacterium]